LLLEAAGVDIKTLLGGAAVIGLAVAFGAQNLMRDYFSGLLFYVTWKGVHTLFQMVRLHMLQT